MKVRAAADFAAGRGREHFEHELATLGVGYRLNQSPTTGRINGYSFTDPTHLDPAGQPVWFTASSIDRGLSWTKLVARLEGPTPALPTPAASEPKKRFETRATYTARTQDESRTRYRSERVAVLATERDSHHWFWRATPEIDPAKIAADERRIRAVAVRDAAERAAALSRTDFPKSASDAIRAPARTPRPTRRNPTPDQHRDRGRGR